MSEQIELATILLTDLVGSTRLASALELARENSHRNIEAAAATLVEAAVV